MVLNVVVLALYVLVLAAIALWASRRISNVGDFFIAGRRVGPWVSAFAYGTTYFSAVMFVGYAGNLGWGFGMNTLWIVAGNAVVGSLLAWLVLARRTRTMTAHLDSITMPEFLAERYDCKALKPLSALVIFLFLLPYSASVYKGLGHLFEVNLGVDYIYVEIAMAAVTAVYLLFGGYLAITITDFFQGLVQLFGVVVMVALLVAPLGGLVGAFSQATMPGNAPALSAPWPPPEVGSAGAALVSGSFPGWLVLTSLVIITSLGVFGLPQMVQKFYSIKRVADIKPAMIISTVFAVIIAGGAYFSGALSHLHFAPEQIKAMDPDMIMPQLLADTTPPWFSALILVVVLAASMSTLSSLVLVASAAVSVDFLGLRVRGDGADPKGVMVLRVLCGIFIGLSVLIAGAKVTFIVNLMVISWGALAGCFMAPYVYGLFWRRATLPGVIAAMVVGLGTAVTLFLIWGAKGVPVAGAVAMVLPLIAMPVVSAVTRPPAEEHIARVFALDDGSPEESDSGS